MILADIGLGDVLWSMFVFFFFVILLWIIFGVIGDIFRSDDLSGVSKAVWCIFIVVVPWLAVFVYLFARGHGMSRRSVKADDQAHAEFDSYVRQAAGNNSAAGEIKSAKELLDSGAISQEEFERIKAQALAGA
jgi:hypothetical protein